MSVLWFRSDRWGSVLELILYLDDPLSVLPGVVIFTILAQNVSYELQLLRWVTQPLHYHTSMVPEGNEDINRSNTRYD